MLAGRGFGKTRTGAEWVREQVEAKGKRRIALVGRTVADTRDVMVEGESGILEISPPWFRPVYVQSNRRLTWPNGAIATTYSADKPDQLRGPQHDAAWCDEIASWRYEAAWDNLMLGLRLGTSPQCVVTTTPRPTKLIRDLLKDKTCAVVRGSTYENLANLAESFATRILAKYEGTTLGRQEIYAEILDDIAGALWKLALIDEHRAETTPDLMRTVVAIDPATTSGTGSAETGIVVAAMGADQHGYVLDDRTTRGTPNEWANIAIQAFRDYRADRIVAEVNNGGEMVGTVLRGIDPNISYSAVWASKGKRTRAEPISALYEQGKVHHVGQFAELEDQMCSWQPLSGDASPDRMDAMVWALTELFGGGGMLIDASSESLVTHNPLLGM